MTARRNANLIKQGPRGFNSPPHKMTNAWQNFNLVQWCEQIPAAYDEKKKTEHQWQ